MWPTVANAFAGKWKARKHGGALSLHLIVVAFFVLAILLCAHLAFVREDSEELTYYVGRVLEKSQLVADDSGQMLESAKRSRSEACTPDDLADLRLLVFNSHHLSDLGRLREGALICSAVWGKMERPIPLPKRHRTTSDGYDLWGSMPSVVDRRLVGDMSSKDDVVAMISPRAFDSMVSEDARISAVVASRDDGYTYEMIGRSDAPTASDRERSPSVMSGDLRVRQCSVIRDICVTGYLGNGGLLAESPPLIAALALLGALSGLGLSVLLSSWIKSRNSMEARLRRSIRDGNFHVVYQPLRKIGDRSLVGFEALARWQDRNGNEVPPDTFIPVIECMGMMREFSKVIIRKALSDLSAVLSANPAVYVSINLSVDDIIDRDIQAYLDVHSRSNGLGPHQVAIEVNERSSRDVREISSAAGILHGKGYRIFLDDFGTGYSNLKHMASMPIDTLKMDRHFTQAIGTDSAVSEMVSHICAMAKAVGASLVAEGIETEAQATYVHALDGEAVGQGWLFGRPVRASLLPEN